MFKIFKRVIVLVDNVKAVNHTGNYRQGSKGENVSHVLLRHGQWGLLTSAKNSQTNVNQEVNVTSPLDKDSKRREEEGNHKQSNVSTRVCHVIKSRMDKGDEEEQEEKRKKRKSAKNTQNIVGALIIQIPALCKWK
jgi:hypothetical protein